MNNNTSLKGAIIVVVALAVVVFVAYRYFHMNPVFAAVLAIAGAVGSILVYRKKTPPSSPQKP